MTQMLKKVAIITWKSTTSAHLSVGQRYSIGWCGGNTSLRELDRYSRGDPNSQSFIYCCVDLKLKQTSMIYYLLSFIFRFKNTMYSYALASVRLASFKKSKNSTQKLFSRGLSTFFHKKNLLLKMRTMSRRSTRSTTRSTTFQAFVSDILPIIVGQEKGWVDAADVASIQATCTGANEILKSGASGDFIWRALATREWPGVGNLVLNRDDDNFMNDDGSVSDELPVGKYSSYRALYIDYPRVWLTMSAKKIKASPKWTKIEHMGKHGTIECGRCGCNCGNVGDCPGIPIESKYRFDRRERLGYYESRAFGECGIVVLNHFCEPCFEKLNSICDLIQRGDYDKVCAKNVYEETTE